MKEFKGTKGEWKVLFESYEFCDTGDYRTEAVIRVGKTNVAQVFQDDEEQEANARLIAAAPDLLEALQQLLFVCQHPGDLGLEGIDAAANANTSIKKALGE